MDPPTIQSGTVAAEVPAPEAARPETLEAINPLLRGLGPNATGNQALLSVRAYSAADPQLPLRLNTEGRENAQNGAVPVGVHQPIPTMRHSASFHGQYHRCEDSSGEQSTGSKDSANATQVDVAYSGQYMQIPSYKPRGYLSDEPGMCAGVAHTLARSCVLSLSGPRRWHDRIILTKLSKDPYDASQPVYPYPPSMHRPLPREFESPLLGNLQHSLFGDDTPCKCSRSNQAQSSGIYEHSSDELSSHQTEISTPESGSLWLAEYSDDGIEKLGENHPFMKLKHLVVAQVFERFKSWKECSVEQDVPYVAHYGAGTANPSGAEDMGEGKRNPKRKRTNADQGEAGEGLTDSNWPFGPLLTVFSKRRRTAHRKLTFACPYTKKDPTVYRDCYKYTLSSIRDVRQHLARYHRIPPYCPRCMATFQTEKERDQHIREFTCPSRSSTELDGITESQRFQLAKESASNISPEDQWFSVFDIVFPWHEPKPQSPYVDGELQQDITLYQQFLTSHGPRILTAVLARHGVISWDLPDEESDLAAYQQTIFEEGLVLIFKQWRARSETTRQSPNMPSDSGASDQDTPMTSPPPMETTSIGAGTLHDSQPVLPGIVPNPPWSRWLEPMMSSRARPLQGAPRRQAPTRLFR
jgi:hypothetical protein